MTLHIRTAGLLDARALAELLNAIIAKGGTTAFVNELTSADIKGWMQRDGAVWHLAEDEGGQVLGFQYFDPHSDAPEEAVDIATFVRLGATGLGVGSKLFTQTAKVAKDLGYSRIEAIIRADNEGGLAYYQSRSFETIKVIHDAELADGTRVDKIWKRYSLR
jgi:L-amino acid N-acyltransferase YncA